MAIEQDLIRAIDAALAGDWHAAHGIVQGHEGKQQADWVHAVLHKIEGDTGNSRYWYGQAGRSFEAFPEPDAELRTIRQQLAAD